MEKFDFVPVLELATKEVGKALNTVMENYGEPTVELAMLSVRLVAIKQLLHGALLLAVTIVCIIMVTKFVKQFINIYKTKGDADFLDGPAVGIGVFGLVGIVCFFSGFLRVTSVGYWSAALGYPEIYIAIKALQAVGFM